MPGIVSAPVVFEHGWPLNWDATSLAKQSALLLSVSVLRLRDAR